MKRGFWLVVGITLLWTGCGRTPPDRSTTSAAVDEVSAGAPTLSIYAVNYPLAYFAERLSGGWASVVFPVPADVDPAYWNPGPEDIARFQQADLILLNGADYAKWLARASLPAAKLVDTAASFEERWIPLDEGTVHSHGPEGEHSHTGWAFTTWLDPLLAIAQAEAIAEALIAAAPEREGEVRQRWEELDRDWSDLDRALTEATGEVGDTPVLFSHPVYQYLERRYVLDGRSVHWEPDGMPGASEWQELEALLVEHPAQWMIWESRPAGEIETKLLGLGIESVVFDPCANVPEHGDLLAVMRRNTTELARIASPE